MLKYDFLIFNFGQRACDVFKINQFVLVVAIIIKKIMKQHWFLDCWSEKGMNEM